MDTFGRFQAVGGKSINAMAYQGFSQRLELAKAFSKAKSARSTVASDEVKAHRKAQAKARSERLHAENLAQRALVESRRSQ